MSLHSPGKCCRPTRRIPPMPQSSLRSRPCPQRWSHLLPITATLQVTVTTPPPADTSLPPAATAAPTSTSTTAPTGQAVIHVVKRGETLGTIAASYGVTVAAIIRANNINNPNLIVTGTKLTIPVSGQTAPTSTPQPAETQTPTNTPQPTARLRPIRPSRPDPGSDQYFPAGQDRGADQHPHPQTADAQTDGQANERRPAVHRRAGVAAQCGPQLRRPRYLQPEHGQGRCR